MEKALDGHERVMEALENLKEAASNWQPGPSFVTRGLMELYTIKDDDGRWMADIAFNNERANLMIISDYGNYANWWPGLHNETAKQFFIRMSTSPSYLIEKLGYGCPDILNFEKTMKKVKDDLAEKLGGSDDALEILEDEIESIEHTTCAGCYWQGIIRCKKLIDSVYGGDLYTVPCFIEPHPRLVAFVEKVWPRFIDALKKELA